MARVLLIDDDRSIGAAIQIMLARQGCDTVFVADVHAGVQFAPRQLMAAINSGLGPAYLHGAPG